jgi:hypothetical protein
MRTASRIANLHTITTNKYQHDGIRQEGAELLDQLIKKVSN